MKKQLIILFVALFAISFSTVYGQNGPSDPPTCTPTASSPVAGVAYIYAATITPLSGSYDGTGLFKWYVTKNVDLINGTHVVNNAGEIIASGWYDINTAQPNGDSITITWTSAALATGVPYYLVVSYEEVNEFGSSNCNAMDLQVYRIVPQNTFWLKIESVADATGAVGGVYQCAANITGAQVIEGSTPTVVYTYGQNVLYAKITASGYVGNWTPTLRLSGAVDDQAISSGSITWTSSGGLSGTFSCTGCTYGNGDYTSNNPMPSTIDGSVIIVTIPFDNNHHRGLADQTIAVAIDGSYTIGAVTINDRSNVGGDCIDALPFEDTVNKIIKARPGLNAVAPNTFISSPTTKP